MSKPLVLTYFKFTALAEKLRLLFEDAGVAYVNEFVSFDNGTMPALKASGKLPFGSVPIVEEGDKVYADSFAIFRLFGERLGYLPKDEYARYLNDLIIGGVQDFANAAGRAGNLSAENGRDAARQEVIEKTAPRKFGELNAFLEKQGTDYFTGNTIALADIYVFDTLRLFSHRVPSFFDNFATAYPKLNALRERVAARPHIAVYLAKTDIPSHDNWSAAPKA